MGEAFNLLQSMDPKELASETEDLKYMWNRHRSKFLSRYLKRDLLEPQVLLTRRKIVEYVSYKNPDCDFLREEWIPSFIARWSIPYLRPREPGMPKRESSSWFSELFAAAGRVRARRLRNLPIEKVSLIDIGCGAGNYFDILVRCGLASHLSYTGVDISEKVVAICNRKYSKVAFPHAKFEIGNILAIKQPTDSFDIVIVNDVFEHLSPRALGDAIKEVVRVTKGLAIVNFFCEDDIADHVIRPIKKYHWNTLSRSKFKELLLKSGLSEGDILVKDTYGPFLGGDRIVGVDPQSIFYGKPVARSSLMFKKQHVGFVLHPRLL